VRPAGVRPTPPASWPTANILQEVTVDEHTISPAGDPFHAASDAQDERPHACNDGWVTIGQIAVDPETGEETEEYALYLCRKCAERS
jgi:hypothetical protein